MSPGHAVPHDFPSWESVYGWLAAALEDATTFQRQRDAARREAEQRNEWLTKEREAWRRTEECLRAEVTREQAAGAKAIADLQLARAEIDNLKRSAPVTQMYPVGGAAPTGLGGALLPGQDLVGEIMNAMRAPAQQLPPATPIRREIAVRDEAIELARVKLDEAREALEAEKATSDRVRTLLWFALQRQAERCDHSGIGLPGCRTCDPISRDEAKRSPAAQSEGGAR